MLTKEQQTRKRERAKKLNKSILPDKMNAIVAFFLVETKESDDDNGDFREILV